MPGGDRTGPMVAGPRNGRAAGYCAGNRVPGYANPGPGRGMGRNYGGGAFRGVGRGGIPWGGGRGRCFGGGGGYGWNRYQYAATYPRQYAQEPFIEEGANTSEIEYLKEQAQYLSDSLNQIEQRIEKLQKKTENQG